MCHKFTIEELARHEENGTLKEFIKRVAPEYILPNGEVAKFIIIKDCFRYKNKTFDSLTGERDA